MAQLTALRDIPSTRTAFSFVAAIIGIDGPKVVTISPDRTVEVTTLSLHDGTPRVEIELSLWGPDSLRTASLRMLDIVHVRNTVVKHASANQAQKAAHSSTASITTRVKLSGATAGVRLVTDGSTRRPVDAVSRAAACVVKWRDGRFSVLVAMRTRAALWSHRDNAPLCARPRPRPRIQPPTRLPNAVDPPSHFAAGQAPANTSGPLPLLADVMHGRAGPCTEVANVTVHAVFLNVDGMRPDSASDKAQPQHATARALRDGCSLCCSICGHRAMRADVAMCEQCSGNVAWRFGPIVLQVSDASCKALGKVADADASALLFGVAAHMVRTDQKVATWAADVLAALVADGGKFTALVAEMKQSDNTHGADLWLRRLLV